VIHSNTLLLVIPEHVIDIVGQWNWLYLSEHQRSLDLCWVLCQKRSELNSWKKLQRVLRFLLESCFDLPMTSQRALKFNWSLASKLWNDLLGCWIVGVIDYHNFGILDLIRQRQSEEHNLHNWKPKQHESASLDLAKTCKNFFSDKK